MTRRSVVSLGCSRVLFFVADEEGFAALYEGLSSAISRAVTHSATRLDIMNRSGMRLLKDGVLTGPSLGDESLCGCAVWCYGHVNTLLTSRQLCRIGAWHDIHIM